MPPNVCEDLGGITVFVDSAQQPFFLGVTFVIFGGLKTGSKPEINARENMT